MRIGVLGGSFDPPHLGHLALAHAATRALELDEVLFIPAMRNPLKHQQMLAAPKHRLEMVRRLIQDEPKFAVSDIELNRGGPSFTLETLQELHLLRPGDYWILMGADALANFLEWKLPEKILRLARIGACFRPPTTLDHAVLGLPDWVKEKIDRVPLDGLEASSTQIRNQIERGFGIAKTVPPDIAAYILEHDLYRSTTD
ncbi:MAG TPA: nicotinate-nucleotide adenylyltransferase [Fimbriimonadaceae bacterium]|nr:nicotinate-nucleotide adenylyltransferase [Fimbriimonadaceae bacterium]HRJ33648.1 nicotinate-nucleotide adenylyltransferase [Fimbriimonadaceae bacterium]